jgi:hypothetical protein
MALRTAKHADTAAKPVINELLATSRIGSHAFDQQAIDWTQSLEHRQIL